MRNWLKNIFIPFGEKDSVVAYRSWVVRWEGAQIEKGYSCIQKRLEAEIFPTKEDANKFAAQLKEAFKLVRIHGTGTRVTVDENQSVLTVVSE